MTRGCGGATVAERSPTADATQLWAGLAAAYLLCVAALETTRLTSGFPSPRGLAASPAALGAGKVWVLLTSALLVSGRPALGLGANAVSLAELVAVTAAAALLVARLGGAAFWRAAIAGHVVATLVVYAGVGLIWLWASRRVAGVTHEPDFGVSSVWLAVLGALAVSALRTMVMRGRQRPELLLFISCTVAGLIGVTLFSVFVAAEHGLAFIFGGLVTAYTIRGAPC
jgi:hypothetical protein